MLNFVHVNGRRKRRLNHAINALSRSIFEVLYAEDVGELLVGDLNGVRFENDKSYRVRKSSDFWVFHQVKEHLEELGEEYGVKVSQVSEADTSRTCCLCGLVHQKTTCTGRVHRGLMVCSETPLKVEPSGLASTTPTAWRSTNSR